MRRRQIALSLLVGSRANPRKVKPEREAHDRLVASIRTFGFFSSLVVKAAEEEGRFAVVAGKRRLAALKEVHAICYPTSQPNDQIMGSRQAYWYPNRNHPP